MDITKVIRGPVLTEKSSKLLNNLKKVEFEIDVHANKPLVKEALQKLFNVQVKSVNIINRKGKVKKFKRRESVGVRKKRAIVTLKDSKSFDILTQVGGVGLMSDQAEKKPASE